MEVDSKLAAKHQNELELKDAIGDDDDATLDGKNASEEPNSFFEVKGKGIMDKSSKDQKQEVVVMDLTLEKTLADLEKEEWYHGCLPFEDIVGLLKEDGDFLVRGLEAQSHQDTAALLTVKWDGKVEDYPINYTVSNNERIFTIDGANKSNDIMKLVKYHNSSGTPVKGKTELKKAIPKQPWELTSDKITMTKKLGAGAYGEVWLGTMQGSSNDPPVEVAIKVKNVNEQNKAILEEMYREARIMRQYLHKNVVRFYGVVLKSKDNAMIVMEYIDGGALNEYLQKNKDVSTKTKVGYAIDIAVGLVYLHSKGCMHRDIACRNCLISVKSGVVKISDFGLSKQAEFILDDYNIPPDERLPIKW
ncbi:Non-specific protein-tyrosine kinase [Trichostrongylus colubriformis]|uniref:Tyrosine-protein kinase n=1 Tax=Trichostrongylus colubriformis TaxID=6319 RepID=A0AAN8FRR0_TRICO